MTVRYDLREIVVSAVAAAAVVATTLCASAPAQAADLVVTAFGGSWDQAYRKCFVDPFIKRTGKSVDVVLGNPVQWINQIAANPSKPPIDVIVGSTDSSREAIKRGLVVKLNQQNVPAIGELKPTLLEMGGGYGFPITYGDFGLMYNTDTIKNPPKSWKEFVAGTIAGKWKAAIPGILYIATPAGEIALFSKIFGGSSDNVQAALDQIKKMSDSGNVTFYSDPNTPLIALRSGDIDIAMYFDGRAWAEHDTANPKVGYLNPAPGAVAFPNMVQLVKNASPLGIQFVKELAAADGQACFSNAMQYTASNTKVKYLPNVQPRIATDDNSLWVNFDDVAKNTPTWIEMWNKQIGR
jgi:putative spermidine/putrescine transport system substrate-binding protein